MEFHNQNITDILLVLAESSGISIISDETVTGKASFYFSESTIDEALNNFLSTYKLYYERRNNYIAVSKIKIEYDKTTTLASIKADDVSIEPVFRKLSDKIGKTILYDTLPSSVITLDIDNLQISDILEICVKKYPDYSVETAETYYYIKRNSEKQSSSKSSGTNALKKNGNLYSINLEKGRFLDVLTKLFNLEQVEYSLFVQSDTQLENLYFLDKDFKTMLQLLLEHGNADYIEKNGIYYILDLQKKGIASKLKDTEIITLKWIAAQDITVLIPSELSASSTMKIDKNTNSILLTGTKEEIIPLKKFIEKVDTPMGGMKYKKIDLKYINAKEIVSLIPAKMIQQPPVLIPGTNSILASGTDETLNILTDFINSIDKKKTGTPIKLKYIQAETLLKNIPPSINKEDIIDSGFPNLLFYTGSEENKELLQHELSLIDKPHPQIKYQLLVIQYTDGTSSAIKPTFMFNPDNENRNESFIFNGELSNIMNLSFDIISKFGYQFAANLNARITENTANVFTDTTLTALSGQEVKFQNTDTYRYIEYNYDNTSTTRSSTTQQITSGLIVGLNGWVSGDNMITMAVNATVSKQNSDSGSSTSTTLPSTSERVVTTQVRTMSGEPVVISGLIKEDIYETESRVPLLGKIPFLGKLFKHTSKSKEKTEIVIYIVPHLIQDTGNSDSDSLNIERYYQKFIGQQYARQ
jgi:type II secretory pathway component GspD/PulD (secretin)